MAALPRVSGTGPEHYRALPHQEVRAALRAIRRMADGPSAAALCVELTALTAVRGGEARGDEIDLESARWTGARAVRRVAPRVPVEVGRAVARERARGRTSGCRGGFDAARVPFERAVVGGRVRRPGGGRGGLPGPRPEKPGRSGVSAVQPAGAPHRTPGLPQPADARMVGTGSRPRASTPPGSRAGPTRASLRPGCRPRRGSASRPDLVPGSSARSGPGRRPRSRPGCRAGERGSLGRSRRLRRWRVFRRHK